MTRRPRVRTLLLLVNLSILLLPLAGIYVLRLYDRELIRRTESELIAQGAFVGAAYREALVRALQVEEPGPNPMLSSPPSSKVAPPPGAPGSSDSSPRPASFRLASYGNALSPKWRLRVATTPGYHPIDPSLELERAAVLPRPPAGQSPAHPPDPFAVRAGSDIASMLQNGGQVTLAGIRVVDPSGIVVATTRSEHGLLLADRNEVRRALKGEPVSVLRERLSDEPRPSLDSIRRWSRVRVFVALPVIEGERVLGVVVLSRSPLSVEKALYENRQALLAALALLVGIVLLVSGFTSLTIARPLGALMAWAEQVGRGERGATAPVRNPVTYEVALLSDAFDRMASTLEARSDYIRTFAAHVSHEFKTPLASIRGTVELLRDHLLDMTEEERGRLLAAHLQDDHREVASQALRSLHESAGQDRACAITKHTFTELRSTEGRGPS